MSLSQLHLSGFAPWRHAAWWLAYSMVGSLLPIWAGVLVLNVYNLEVGLATFASHGEFFIYSASFATPVFHHLHRDWRGKQFLHGRWFQWFAVLSVLVSAVVYGVLLASEQSAEVQAQLDMSFVYAAGYVLLPLTILLGFLVTAFEQVMTGLDAQEVNRSRQKKLGEDFDELG